MRNYSSLCDDYYVNMNMSTEMDLPNNRESVLHFFERLQKTYPTMRNFYTREKGDFVIEEDKERGHYRWSAIEPRRICSGYVNPERVEDAMTQHRLVLETAPYSLSVSPLDCEALDLLYGFDFTYRGNQNQLVADALGLSPIFEKLTEKPGLKMVNYEPSITLGLDNDCRLQCRVSVETRTAAYHIRSGDFPEEQLSVYFTARHYGSLGPDTSLLDMLERLHEVCREYVDGFMTENILAPLQRAIALK